MVKGTGRISRAPRAAKKQRLAVNVLASEEIAKPREDIKEYRLVSLPNDMRVLLISDPSLKDAEEEGEDDDEEDVEGGEEEEEDEGEDDGEDDDEEGGKKAACAVCVGVGSLCDPRALGGLAHFAEHMVFMGTSKYPTENEWSEYLAKHGGEDNGETSLETTTCYFDVNPAHLHDTLDRFASFFSSPLFNFDSAQREVQAIESEFQQAKNEDDNRHYQLLCHLASPSHPFHGFSWGDKRSLQEQPAARGDDMRAALTAFHSKYYSSHLMTAVVLGQEPLDTLQSWAASAFADMPRRELTRPSFESVPPPFAETDAPADGEAPARRPPLWVRQVPLRERRRLELSWFVPSLLAHHRSKPELFVTHVLGHEADGSVLWALKEEGLAFSLCAGVDEEEMTTNSARFSIQVDLTPEGITRIERVIELVFGGVGDFTRRAPEEWIFNELRDLSKLRFEFSEAENEIDYVRRLAISLQHAYTPAQTLSADFLVQDFDAPAVRDLLGRLTPQSVIATLMYKPTAAAANGGAAAADDWQVEPWFGTEYTVDSVDANRLATWQAAYDGHGAPPTGGGFTLPPKNEFVPTDFALRAESDRERTTRPPPVLLDSDGRGRLFHAPDVRFATPKAVVCLQIEVRPPGAPMTREQKAEWRVLGDAAARYVIESINADAYAATIAGYSYEIGANPHGWYIEVHGFSHKLARVLRRLCAALRALADAPADAPMLQRVLTEYEQQRRNACFDAGDLAIDERLRCLEVGWLTAADKLAALPAATPEGVSAHVAAVLEHGVHVTCYTGGNLDQADARSLYADVHTALGAPPPLEPLAPLKHCVQLSPGRAERAVLGKNPNDENSAVDLYWQIGADEPTLSAKLNLLEHLMYEPLFDALRTKQQLGYTVSCSARNTQGALGFLISVVSQTHAADDIEKRAMSFVEGFVADLKKMPKDEYASNVQAAVANRLLADKTIDSEAGRYWSEIDMRTYAFTKAEDEAGKMRATTQAQLAAFAKKALLADDARRLSVIVRPQKGATDADKATRGTIDDPAAFAESQPQHPRNFGKLPTVLPSVVKA